MRLWALGLLPLLAVPSAAQRPDFRVDVETVPVYVSVVDKKGRPIKGLSREQFQLLEDGVPQQIDTFYEVTFPSGSQQTPLPRMAEGGRAGGSEGADSLQEQRYLVVRFDPLLSFRDLERAKKAALELVEELAPGDLMAVSWQNFLSEFSSDKGRLRSLIQELRPSLLTFLSEVDAPADPQFRGQATGSGSGGQPLGSAEGPGRDFGELFGGGLAQQNVLANAIQEVVTLGTRGDLFAMIGRLKYLKGRKIALYFGYGLPNPLNDSRKMDLFDPKINARLFNDAGFAVFAINPQGGVTRPVGGFSPYGPGGRLRGGGGLSPRQRSELVFATPSQPGFADTYLRRWAETTGGMAIYNRNNLAKAVRQVFEFNSHYYVLAYRSKKDYYDAKYRRIEVKVEARDVRVHHRGGYFATLPGAAELRARSLLTAAMMPQQFRDFPVRLEIGKNEPSRLDLKLFFPFGPVRLTEIQVPGKKKGEVVRRYLQEIYVFIGVFDQNNRLLGVAQETFFLDLAEEQLQQMRAQNAALERSLRWEKGNKASVLKSVIIVGQNEQIATTVLEIPSGDGGKR